MKRWFGPMCIGFFLATLALGCGGGESAPAPAERESVVSEKPAVPPANAPEDAPEEGRLPDRFKR